MCAPRIFASPSNWMSMCLPKREELLFRVVFAFPIGSITGFVHMMRSPRLPPEPPAPPLLELAACRVLSPRCRIASFIVRVLKDEGEVDTVRKEVAELSANFPAYPEPAAQA